MCFLSFSISKYLKYVLKIGSTAKHEPVCLHVLHKRYAALVFFLSCQKMDNYIVFIKQTYPPATIAMFILSWTEHNNLCTSRAWRPRQDLRKLLFIYFPTTNLSCFCSLIITISFQKGLKKRNFPHTYHSTYYLIWAGFIRNNELSCWHMEF